MSTKEKLIKKLKSAKEIDFEDIHLLLTQLGLTTEVVVVTTPTQSRPM